MNWKEQLAAYTPQDNGERHAKEGILQAAAQYDSRILDRNCGAGGHVTCSAMILDEAMESALMVYHLIYQSFSWTGGHADGDSDFAAVALREAKEETGIQHAAFLSSEILSLDVLPVPAHEKNGVPVPAHVHYNISYGLIAGKREKLIVKPDENSDVAWILLEKLPEVCKEKHMLPIYEKLICRMQQVKAAQQRVLAESVMPLCSWYATHARDLPWRRDTDPYHVWISEIMLQQTRVEAVKDYYLRFLQQFPDIQTLAAADAASLQKAWEGLGYYTRARNLHRAAKEICTEYGGVFPTRQEEIRQLPGVGDYTAGAICSICYGQPTPAVDGNVLRVVMRLQDCFFEIDRLIVRQQVTQALAKVYPAKEEALCRMLTQALMELGATVCIPNGAPHCAECPLAALCRSARQQTMQKLPVRKQKAPRKKVPMTVFLLCCDGKYAVCQRPRYGLLANLWEFPNVEAQMDDQQMIQQVKSWGCRPLSILKTVKQTHIFTHLEWHMEGVLIECGNAGNLFHWETLQQIQESLAVPAAFQKFFPVL